MKKKFCLFGNIQGYKRTFSVPEDLEHTRSEVKWNTTTKIVNN